MKVSLNWLKDYLSLDQDPETTGEILTSIGLEVEGLELKEQVEGGLEGVIVGHVLTCGQHPNADKLSVTTVNVGGEEPLHIVCGAPNVAAGQKVFVAQVGSRVLDHEGNLFKLKKGKIRGEVSEGMICAQDELGIGSDHSGIMVLPEETAIGTTAKDYLNLQTDYVYDIGLTPNRSDATNHLGVAMDLAAYLKINGETDPNLKLPNVEAFKIDRQDGAIEIEIKDAAACPRYSGLVINNLTIGDSPDWLKARLMAIDVRPINNVVDITNFVLHELGQPLHAFDLSAIKGNKIIVEKLPAGTSFVTLDEVERKLLADDLMICDGNSTPMCMGGVFGGLGSGVSDSTTAIFLESAHFHAKTIRRSSMSHNLRTDAAKVFEKGSDPNVTLYALKRAAMLIKEIAGGEIVSDIFDFYPNPIEKAQVTVRWNRVSGLIGVDIPQADIKAILAALDMDILEENDEQFVVAIPTNKADVTREADVIEEILRIYGFNKVPIPERFHTSINHITTPTATEVREKLSDFLTGLGFSEMMAVSLEESRYYKEMLTSVQEEDLVYINNTSNVSQDIMRADMIFSALEAVEHNQNRQVSDIKLFEFGKSYRAVEGGFKEPQHLTLTLGGHDVGENWLVKQRPMDYYTLKGAVSQVMDRLGFAGFQVSESDDDRFQFGMKFHRGPQVLVEFGQVAKKLQKGMGIKNPVFYADFNWDAILKASRKNRISYQEIPRFPSMRRDLAFVVDTSIKFADIEGIGRKAGKKLLQNVNLFDVYENAEQLGADKKSYAVSFVFQDENKTLKDKEVDKVMNQIIATSETKLGAVIRR